MVQETLMHHLRGLKVWGNRGLTYVRWESLECTL